LKKVFLEDLPKKLGIGANANKECIDWNKSIGNHVKFIYDDIEDKVEIINYDVKKQKLDVKYNNIIYPITITGFKNCQLGEVLGTHMRKYRYNVGDIIQTFSGEIQILEQTKASDNQKKYKYKCLIDGNIDQIYEFNLTQGNGCNVCTNKKILKGYNDLWTTHLKTAKLLKHSEFGYELSYGSTKSEIFICPDCGCEKSYKVYVVVSFGFSCPKCGDGFSYPNKFGFNLLEQLGIDFIPEYSPDWIKPKKYDDYFKHKDKEYILEMDGGIGHGNSNTLSKLTIKESKEIDDYKDLKAKEKEIEVIRIDCKESNLEYIKSNILSSKLNDIFDLSNIDWLRCHEYACNNLVKVVCDLWNSGINSTWEISEQIKIHKATVWRYLKLGVELGWCDYDPEEVMKKVYEDNDKRNKENLSIPIIQLTRKNDLVKKWDNARSAYRELKIEYKNISAVCRGLRETAGGFKWQYYDEYIKLNPTTI